MWGMLSLCLTVLILVLSIRSYWQYSSLSSRDLTRDLKTLNYVLASTAKSLPLLKIDSALKKTIN